jgi:pimeloyl-ACP methyl ester carboxylesterase
MDATIIVKPGRDPTSSPGGGLALRALRAGFGTLGAVAPGAAALLAERLWFTPPRPRRSPASRRAMRSGHRFALFPGGRRVAGWTFGNGPVVLLMHGWGGHAAQMQPLALELAARGMRAVVLDAPGHGDSGPSRLGGGRSTFFDFADALGEAHALLGPAVALAAHSGGGVAAHLALRAGLPVRRLVLLAPMTRPARYADRYREVLGIPARVDAAWRSRAEERLRFRWEDLDVTRPPTPAPPPVLVLHDRDDAEVEWQDGAAVAEGWPGARLVLTSGLGHRRLLREHQVLKLAADFLAEAGDEPGAAVRKAG